MFSIRTHIPFAIAIALFATCVTSASAFDKLKKEPGFLYVASFNVFKFGGIETERYKEPDVNQSLPLTGEIPKRILNVASVLAFGDFDLVAMQEVRAGKRGEAAVFDLRRALKEKYGLSYDFIMSGDIGQGYQMKEAMAFLYKSERVLPEPVNDSETNWIIIKIDNECTDPQPRSLVQTQWESGHFDFTLISAHLAYGNECKRRAGYALIHKIFNNPSSWSDDPDIIVLGDFNRLGKKFNSIAALPYDPTKFRAPNITFFDPGFSKIAEVDEKSIFGKNIPNDDIQLLSTTVAGNTYAYDIIMFSQDKCKEFPAELHKARYGIDFGIIHFDHPGGVGFQQNAEKLRHDELKVAYSDHRPVWTRFRIDNSDCADD